MLSTKLNVAFSAGTINKTSSSVLFGKWSFVKLNNRSYPRNNAIFCCNFDPSINRKVGQSSKLINSTLVLEVTGTFLHPIFSRSFVSAPSLEDKADIFGELGDRKSEKIELDEFEQKEEEFLMNEAKPHHRLVPSLGKYVEMIKMHIKSGDLEAGIGVLDQVKKDRNKPNNHMYNLLIRAFAMQGNLKKCFRLYNQMKKQGLKPTLATYVSLLNVCGNCSDTRISLEKLDYVRQILIEKGIQYNVVHYNAMIKAYGRHGKLLEAFQLVDEMRDKKLTIGISTFNFLLQGAISDKEAGFRHALVVWQLLRCRKLKPDIFTYNLLLRTARDCKLGDLKIDDLLVFDIPGANKPSFISTDRTNLLAHPPEVCTELPLIAASTNSKFLDADDTPPETNTGSAELVANNGSDGKLQMIVMNPNTSGLSINLKISSPETNLLLMGGFKNFVDQMRVDNIRPDIRTMTYLVELVPPTIAAETSVVNYAKSNGIQLDVTFYNLLIKKRSFRFEYKDALKVLSMMQQDNLEPDIMTWGVLALGCRSCAQAKEIFEGMEQTGHRINIPIVGAILSQASTYWQFELALELMEKMRIEGPKPTESIYAILERMKWRAINATKDENAPHYVHKPFWQNGFRKFNLRYSTWLKEMKEESENSKKKSL